MKRFVVLALFFATSFCGANTDIPILKVKARASFRMFGSIGPTQYSDISATINSQGEVTGFGYKSSNHQSDHMDVRELYSDNGIVFAWLGGQPVVVLKDPEQRFNTSHGGILDLQYRKNRQSAAFETVKLEFTPSVNNPNLWQVHDLNGRIVKGIHVKIKMSGVTPMGIESASYDY